MTNLIGKTADETRANVLSNAAANGLQVIEDRRYDNSLEQALYGQNGSLVYLMAFQGRGRTINVNIYSDGRITREVR